MTDSTNPFRVALANLRFPENLDHSVALSRQAIREARDAGAELVCFPECFVPGYRAPNRNVPLTSAETLQKAWAHIADEARLAQLTVVLGTERFVAGQRVASALVIAADGTQAGFQDKVQIDPSEEGTYGHGFGRAIFRAGALTFGICICHEGFRYPETVRWAACRGAQVVFHPQFHEAEPGSYRSTAYGDPQNTFHEKSALCRAAENSCYFATVNYASDGSPTTSAIAKPDGTLLSHQPYGREGLLIADLDLSLATGLLAERYRPVS